MKLAFWKVIWWIRYKFPKWLIGIPKRLVNYQIYKTTLFEKFIFIACYLLGFGFASDEASNPFEFIFMAWLYGNLLGWFFFGSWRWFIRNFTPHGY